MMQNCTLQYIFCCPLKCAAENCLIGDGEAAIPKWQHEGKTFVEWIKTKLCFSLPCSVCTCSLCSEPVEDDSNICSSVCTYFSDTGIKKSLICKCLQNDCVNPITHLCSKVGDWKCLICAKEESSLNMCDNCQCFSIVNSEPFSCPTYKIRVSSNLRDITQCPSCPNHVFCFTCLEDQFVICCCHYIFCNRCGDPYFRYDDQDSICSYKESNCCSFLFQILLNIPRLLCFGFIGLCENNIRCCYFTSQSLAYLLCCKCTDEAFCHSYTCLCFDCDKIKISEIDQLDDDIKGCKCSCCIYTKRKRHQFLDFDIEIPKEEDPPKMTNNDHTNRELKRRVNDDNSMFEIENETQESFDKSLNKTVSVSKKPRRKSQLAKSHVSKSLVNECHDKDGKINLESDTSSENGDSYVDVMQIRGLQKKLICNDDEIDSNVKIIGNTGSIEKQHRNSSFDKCSGRQGISRSLVKNEGSFESPKFHKTGIMKSRSAAGTFYDGNIDIVSKPFSIYDNSEDFVHKTRKRAHFVNEDKELIKELFPVKESNFSTNDLFISKVLDETGETSVGVSTRRKRKLQDGKNLRPRKKSTSLDANDNDSSVSKSNKLFLTEQNLSGSKTKRSPKKKSSSCNRQADKADDLRKCGDITIVDYDSSEEIFAVDKVLDEEKIKIEDLEDFSQ